MSSRSAALPSIAALAPHRELILLGALLVGFHGAAVGAMLAGSFRGNVALILAEGGVYALAVWRVLEGRRVPLSFILAVAALLRLALVAFDPCHSSDIYRYVWDGRVQGAGINPYLFIPNDPALADLRDEAIYPHINRATYAPTIYPPVAQALFFFATRISESLVWMKTVLVAFEALAIWAIVRLLDLARLPRERVVIYAWSPLVIWEFAGNGHLDAAMIAFILLAVLAARLEKDALAGFALGAAVLVKFFPLVLVPALWRRWGWRLPAALAATLVVGYGPYAFGAGWRVLGFIPGYLGEEGLGDASGFWLTQLGRTLFGVEPHPLLYLGAAGMLLATLGLFVLHRPDREERLFAGALALAATAMLALSPSYPWYFAWLLPFLCFVPSWPLVWLSTAAFVLYWDNQRAPWMADVLYGTTFLLLAATLVQAIRARRLIPERNMA